MTLWHHGKDKAQWLSTLGPIVMGYAVASMTFGAIATALHLGTAITLALSLLLYSGALQSTVLGLLLLNPSFLLLAIIAFSVNLRHMLYGPHLETNQRHWTQWDRWVVSFGLTDELYALGLDPTINLRSWRIAALVLYGSWGVSTAIGVAGAHLLPKPWLVTLSIALPSLFVGLLVPRLTGTSEWVAASTALALALIGRIAQLPEAYYVVPIIVGASVAYFTHRGLPS